MLSPRSLRGPNAHARGRDALGDSSFSRFSTNMNKLYWLTAMTLVACGGAGSPDCDAPGHACTWLGLPGESGFNGDGKGRLDTKLYWSMDMAFDAAGSAW